MRATALNGWCGLNLAALSGKGRWPDVLEMRVGRLWWLVCVSRAGRATRWACSTETSTPGHRTGSTWPAALNHTLVACHEILDPLVTRRFSLCFHQRPRSHDQLHTAGLQQACAVGITALPRPPSLQASEC